jgi:hypothetical protein
VVKPPDCVRIICTTEPSTDADAFPRAPERFLPVVGIFFLLQALTCVTSHMAKMIGSARREDCVTPVRRADLKGMRPGQAETTHAFAATVAALFLTCNALPRQATTGVGAGFSAPGNAKL